MSNITTNAKLQEWVTSLNKYANELNELIGIMRDENCDLNNYVFPPISINRNLMAAGRVGGIKRRKAVIPLLEELSDGLTKLVILLRMECPSFLTITRYALMVNLVTTYDMLMPLGVKGLNSYGEARQAVSEMQDVDIVSSALHLPPELDTVTPTPMSEVTPFELTGEPLTPDVHRTTDEVVKTTNPNAKYFNLVTDIHRVIEIKFEQHDKYFGGYDETDMASLMDCGYLIWRDLNDFLAEVIDKEELLPNGITLLELITINNNLAFISDLVSSNSPIDSFELYVWNVYQLLPEVVSGEVDVLQQTLNRLKDLSERLHSHKGVLNTLNSLFAFGMGEGISIRGSRPSGMRSDLRGRSRAADVSRDYRLQSDDRDRISDEEFDRGEDLRDREEEVDRYYREHGRRGRCSRSQSDDREEEEQRRLSWSSSSL